MRSYSSFILTYGNESGVVLHFQQIPSASSSSSSAAAAAAAPVPVSSEEPRDSSLLALSHTALASTNGATPQTQQQHEQSTQQTEAPTTSPHSPSSTPSSSPSSNTWMFVKVLDQKWDVKTWAEVDKGRLIQISSS